MAHGKNGVRLSAVLVVLAGVLGFHLEVMGMIGSPADDAGKRPDLIRIETIAELEELEQPAAVFLHDAHTKALKEQGKSCDSCHKKDENGKMSLKFMRQDGENAPKLDADQLKELYHDGCVSCHTENAAAKIKTGPMVGECRSCHQEKSEFSADRAPAGMDKVLHFRHWDSKEIPADMGGDTNCGACHHVYDKAEKKAVYVKGEEDTCRSCHTAQPEGDVKLNTSEAFHAQCVTCHESLIQKKAEKFGPVDCAGCHGEKGIAETKAHDAELLAAKGGKLPRLPRKQPDAVLMTGPAPEKDVPALAGKIPTGMAPVAFDHKLHEDANDSCRSCHHKTLQACSECHTPQGKKEGGFVSLDQAMHSATSDRSCIGCHAVRQQKPQCAGCHDFMSTTTPPSDASCAVCHDAPTVETVPASSAENGAEDSAETVMTETKPVLWAAATDEAKTAEALELIKARPETHAVPAEKDIPEFVTIGAIAKDYEPSKMPHRKIVMSLLKGMKNDAMAQVFHASPETVCAGCHHNSPASKTPPTCASCHSTLPDAVSGKPGLKAAYHGQCMGCHTKMKLEKPAAVNCVACHEKKTNS